MLLAIGMAGQVWAAAPPVVSNVRASQRAGTGLVDVYYDVADADSGALTVSIAVSTNGGASYAVGAANFTGALGTGIAPGSSRKITWNAGVDLPARLFSNVRVSVTASDDTAPSGMVHIPSGSFTMGDNLDGSSYALPLHSVYVSAFYMDKYEVTKAFWEEVYLWAITRGYSFDNPGLGKAANHPVHTVSWHDAVKWCNARSEKEGRIPAYYTSAAQTTAYRSGQVNVQNDWVKWNVGYRLPTETEWEKAARGAASGRRFPWMDADTITHNRANYYSSTNHAYDTSPTRDYHPPFNDGIFPYTSPVGYFAPNGYGLYDMAGNVWEWSWDWWNSTYYSSSPGTDPRGPTTGFFRGCRGGGWYGYAISCRTAGRIDSGPTGFGDGLGFRSVLPPLGLPAIAVQPQNRTASRGGSATFNVSATGDSPLSYQWQRNGTDIPSAMGASLTVTNVQSSANYSVIVRNALGIVISRTARLSLSGGIGEI